MAALEPPWRDQARAELRPKVSGASSLELRVDGTLLAVVETLTRRDPADFPFLRVTLPDRRSPPYVYEGRELLDLMRTFRGKELSVSDGG